jgi:hypothetical protein
MNFDVMLNYFLMLTYNDKEKIEIYGENFTILTLFHAIFQQYAIKASVLELWFLLLFIKKILHTS